jgi:hypothetical protein
MFDSNVNPFPNTLFRVCTVQWSICVAKMDVLSDIRPYFGGLFPSKKSRWCDEPRRIGSQMICSGLTLFAYSILTTISGWWFGAWILWLSIGNFTIPTDELIFFRGVGWNHQPGQL